MENKENTIKGSNEHDVEIAKAKGTNEHDVEVARVKYDIEQIRQNSILELEKYKTEQEQEVKKLKLFTETAKGLGYAGMALTWGIMKMKIGAEVRKHEIEFTRD